MKIKKLIKLFLPYGLIILYNNIKQSRHNKKQNKEVQRWFSDNGDETLRLNYEQLNSNSTVFDLGGYKGDFASNIYSKYCCNIYIFEPVKEYSNKIINRFSKNIKIKVFPFGLGAKKETMSISINNDASSIFNTGNETQIIELISFKDFLNENSIDHIDLIKINIEGGEYELLNHIIESNLVSCIDNFQIQFHDFISNADTLRKNIQDKLQLTHCLTYNYNFVWENWKKK